MIIRVRFVLLVHDLGVLGAHLHQVQLVYICQKTNDQSGELCKDSELTVEEIWPRWDTTYHTRIRASMMTLRLIELALYIP